MQLANATKRWGRRIALSLLALIAVGGALLLAEHYRVPTESEIYAAYLNLAVDKVRTEQEGDFVFVLGPTTRSVQKAIHYSKFWNAGSSVEQELAKYAPRASPRAIQALAQVGEDESNVGADVIRLAPRGVTIHIASEGQLRTFFSDTKLGEAWKKFYSVYPKARGLTTFSRVGFDPETRQAVMLVSFACGGLCGSGHSVVLEKRWTGWTILESKMVWLS